MCRVDLDVNVDANNFIPVQFNLFKYIPTTLTTFDIFIYTNISLTGLYTRILRACIRPCVYGYMFVCLCVCMYTLKFL